MRGIYFYDAFNDVDNTDFLNLEFKKEKHTKILSTEISLYIINGYITRGPDRLINFIKNKK